MPNKFTPAIVQEIEDELLGEFDEAMLQIEKPTLDDLERVGLEYTKKFKERLLEHSLVSLGKGELEEKKM